MQQLVAHQIGERHVVIAPRGQRGKLSLHVEQAVEEFALERFLARRGKLLVCQSPDIGDARLHFFSLNDPAAAKIMRADGARLLTRSGTPTWRESRTGRGIAPMRAIERKAPRLPSMHHECTTCAIAPGFSAVALLGCGPHFANSMAGFSKALNSIALPQGSRKNIVACSPGCPLKRICGSMMNSIPAATSLSASLRQASIGSTRPKWRTGTLSPSTRLVSLRPAPGARCATIWWP